MDFKRHFERTWKITLEFIAPLILMTVVMALACLVTLGILTPVLMAGYFQSILLMLRERRVPKIQDLFSRMNLFFPLLGFSVVVLLAMFIGFIFLVLPGILVALAASYLCLYMLPLMTDKGLTLTEAVKESYRMTIRGNVGDQVVVFILFIGISALGGSVFIAWLFTQPLASVFLMSVYDEMTGDQVDMEHAGPVQGSSM
jgi:hypothetical protein